MIAHPRLVGAAAGLALTLAAGLAFAALPAWAQGDLPTHDTDAPRPLQPSADPTAIQSEPLPPPAEAAPPEVPALGGPGAAATPAPDAAPPETTMTPPPAAAPDAAPDAAIPAAPAAPATVLLSPDWQPRGIATLQALDKHDVRVARIEVAVGQSGHFGALTIAVRACLARPPDQATDAAALLQVSDARPGAPGFSGWMFAAEPALAILENPIYDVRVLACH